MSSRPNNARTTTLLLGAATVIAQAILLREAMAALGGSETVWGVVMALWLIGVAAGSRLGVRWGTSGLVSWLPPVTLILSAVGVVALRAAPAVLGLAAGEAPSTIGSLWLWALAVIPAALAGGLAFPLLAEQLGDAGGGRAYAIEALGALIGGTVLSAALIGYGSAAALSISIGICSAVAVWGRSRLLAIVFAIIGIAAAIPSGEALAGASWRWRGLPGPLSDWSESRMQRLELSAGDPLSVYADGRLLASYPDHYRAAPRGHLMMLVHPAPRKVFAVGCAGDGSLDAMVHHPFEDLRVVEEDPRLLELIPSWYGARMAGTLADERIHLVAADPVRALETSGSYDLILLTDGNPTSLRRNRTRTLEFFQSCRRHLEPDGILVLALDASNTYQGGAAGRLTGTMIATLAAVFPQIEIAAGQMLLLAGGPEAELPLAQNDLEARVVERGLEATGFIPEMIPLLLDRERAEEIAKTVGLDHRVNSTHHPSAVLIAAGLREGRSRPSLLRFILALERLDVRFFGIGVLASAALLLVPFLTGRGAAKSTAVVVGFGSMGWWLLAMAVWQLTRGSVYSEIGVLASVFMGGLAAGAFRATRQQQSHRHLPAVLIASAALSGLLATGLGVRYPLLVVPLALGAGGFLTGASFPALVQLTKCNQRRGAGSVFAIDEIGAAFAALVIGLLSIPVFGLAATAAALAILQLAAIPGVVTTLRHL